MTDVGVTDRVLRIVAPLAGVTAAAWLAVFIFTLGSRGPARPLAVVIDALLLAGFGALHSFTAAARVKRPLAALAPALPRALHLLGSLVGVAGIALLWQPVGGDLWRLGGVAGLALDIAYWVLLTFGALAIVQLDALAFFGARAERGDGTLATAGAYRVVRHPLYTIVLLALPCASTLTGDRLLLAAVFTLYMLAALPREEAKLRVRFGDAYRTYCREVPALVPRMPLKRPA